MHPWMCAARKRLKNPGHPGMYERSTAQVASLRTLCAPGWAGAGAVWGPVEGMSWNLTLPVVVIAHIGREPPVYPAPIR